MGGGGEMPALNWEELGLLSTLKSSVPFSFIYQYSYPLCESEIIESARLDVLWK